LFEDGKIAAFKSKCKFIETSVAINDKVDDLLAGVLKQIRLSKTLQRELSPQNDLIDASSNQKNYDSSSTTKVPKNNSKNYTRSQTEDLNTLKKNNDNNNNNNHTNFISFRSNTLSRRLFKSTRKDPRSSSTNSSASNFRSRSPPSQNKDNNSFFHKMINVFRKKSSFGNMQSVENLYTPPNYSLNDTNINK
jgi:hypothetical protein